MTIAWTEDLAVGFEEIDQQHQELFRRIDQLMEACSQGRGKEAVIDVVKFLETYVVTHFKNEDNLMTQTHYPDRLSHLEQHHQFIRNFQELKQKIETDGVAAYTVILTNRVVVGWLNDHIRKVDKLLGQFLKEHV